MRFFLSLLSFPTLAFPSLVEDPPYAEVILPEIFRPYLIVHRFSLRSLRAFVLPSPRSFIVWFVVLFSVSLCASCSKVFSGTDDSVRCHPFPFCCAFRVSSRCHPPLFLFGFFPSGVFFFVFLKGSPHFSPFLSNFGDLS